MTKRMLIDATHAEETRVVVLDGNRLEDFDVETSTKKQLKGNIYLAKVVRVEPSLQAAFVEYGGGRHGFLAFGEIHPDYYQIPVADRQRLLAMQAEEARAEEEDEEEERPVRQSRGRDRGDRGDRGGRPSRNDRAEAEAQPAAIESDAVYGEMIEGKVTFGEFGGEDASEAPTIDAVAEAADPVEATETVETVETDSDDAADVYGDTDSPDPDQPPPETIGGESDVFEGNGAEEARQRRASRFLRNYRIQEVIRRRQIMLIQVVKEERGTKGAALTTYISLAGRFCVLMPNSPRGGGISRKITSAADRRRLKEITSELEIPQGMGLIVRTAGAARPKPEIKRDCEYLMRLWDDIREHTLKSMAPALIYEEASLIKRAIRDGYSRDIDEVMVDGEEGWRAAHDFMRMLMPTHAKKVIAWKATEGGAQPLFAKMGVEAQLDAMLSPTVQLKSGGYLIINQAEALVAIDVNSGRATRERGIEETALKTNLEAADEAARQLRLRDLAGLIVIDFIDMESKKNNAMVERRLKEALKNDRARIQVGHISHFGLLEMSRQRLRPSLAETNFVTCPHCNGLGHVRGIESSAIHVLRAIEEEGAKGRASLIIVYAASAVVMYLLNHKRARLGEIEDRYAMTVHFAGDETLVPPAIRIDRVRAQVPENERPTPMRGPVAPVAPLMDADEEEADDVGFADDEPEAAVAPQPVAGETEATTAARAAEEEGERRRRRRRRRRGGRREDGDTAGGPATEGDSDAEGDAEGEAKSAATDEDESPDAVAAAIVADLESAGTEAPVADAADPAVAEQPSLDPADLDENGQPRARRRGRRGGRRRRRDGAPGDAPAAGEEGYVAEAAPEPPPPPPAPVYEPPVYSGPTPANPFGGQPLDIFDLMDQVAEQEAAAPPPKPTPPPAPPVVVAPEPAAPEPVAVVVAPVKAEPEPAPAVVEPAPEPAAPAPIVETPVKPTPEPQVAPAIRPIVIGEDPLPTTPPKRGWWRR